MKRMLIAMSAACVPMLSMAAPPILEPVDVNVTNPSLAVEVSNADAIPVAMISSSTPFQVELCRKKGAGTCNLGLGDVASSVDVPSNKRLVIEFVSAKCGLSPSPNYLYRLVLRTTAGSTRLDHHLPGINPAFVVALETRIYADPGTTVDFSDILSDSSDAAACYMTISGQLANP